MQSYCLSQQQLSFLSCMYECVYCCNSVTSDDILAKYRKPAANKSTTDNIAAGPAAAGPPAVAVAADAVAKSKDKADDEMPSYDSNNLEMCQAFLDAKKKLRLILSSVDLQVSGSGSHLTMHPTIGLIYLL